MRGSLSVTTQIPHNSSRNTLSPRTRLDHMAHGATLLPSIRTSNRKLSIMSCERPTGAERRMNCTITRSESAAIILVLMLPSNGAPVLDAGRRARAEKASRSAAAAVSQGRLLGWLWTKITQKQGPKPGQVVGIDDGVGQACQNDLS